MFSAATKFNLACFVFLLLATNVELRFMTKDKILWKIPGSSQGDLSCSPSNGFGLSGKLDSILNNSYLLRLREILKQFWNANFYSFGSKNDIYSNDKSSKNDDNYKMVYIPINDDKPEITIDALKLDSDPVSKAETKTKEDETKL